MFERVVDFIESSAERCKCARESGTYAELRAHIAEIGERLVQQDRITAERRAATRHFHELREALLRDHMAPIARIAAATVDPTRERMYLSMPPRWAAPGDLVRHANAMAVECQTHRPTFLRAGLPEAFEERLVAAADALVQSTIQREDLARTSAAATASVGKRISQGRAAVRVLDAMVRSEGAADASLVAGWRTAVLVAGRERGRLGSGGGPGTSLVPVGSSVVVPHRIAQWRRILESMRGAIAGVWRQLRVRQIGVPGGSARAAAMLTRPPTRKLPPGAP
jgi:hypothetical protein